MAAAVHDGGHVGERVGWGERGVVGWVRTVGNVPDCPKTPQPWSQFVRQPPHAAQRHSEGIPSPPSPVVGATPPPRGGDGALPPHDLRRSETFPTVPLGTVY